MAYDNYDEEAPPEFRCPITQQAMKVPVVAPDGHSYEQSAIEGWFNRGNKTSPITRERMASETLLPNHQLKSHIAAWRDKQQSQVELQTMLTPIIWSSSEEKALDAISALMNFIKSRELFVSSLHLRKLRASLAADDAVWCKGVDEALRALEAHCEATRSSLLSRLDQANAASEQASTTERSIRRRWTPGGVGRCEFRRAATLDEVHAMCLLFGYARLCVREWQRSSGRLRRCSEGLLE